MIKKSMQPSQIPATSAIPEKPQTPVIPGQSPRMPTSSVKDIIPPVVQEEASVTSLVQKNPTHGEQMTVAQKISADSVNVSPTSAKSMVPGAPPKAEVATQTPIQRLATPPAPGITSPEEKLIAKDPQEGNQAIAISPASLVGAVSSDNQHQSKRENRLSLVLVQTISLPLQHLLENPNGKLAGVLTGLRKNSIVNFVIKKVNLRINEVNTGDVNIQTGEDIPKKKFPLSFFTIVVLPTLLAFIYFGLLASDQYESSADYIIKTPSGNSPSSGISGIMGLVAGGGSSSSTPDDLALVQNYISSYQILKDISKDIDLRAIYSSNGIDWFSRLKTSPDILGFISFRKTRRTTTNDISDEDLLKYWTNMVQVLPGQIDPNTATLQVSAFTPEDAKNIADHVIALGEYHVNQVSERAMNNAVVFAQQEVDKAHDRAIKTLDQEKELQARVKVLDPSNNVISQSTIQSTLEANYSSLQGQIRTLLQQLPENAPAIQQMRQQSAALQDELLAEKNAATKSIDGKSAAEVMNEYNKLQMEAGFASSDYTNALAALETARITANQQNRYLEAFDPPNLPDKPSYPRRWYDILSVLALTLLLWGIWSLFIAGVREHQH